MSDKIEYAKCETCPAWIGEGHSDGLGMCRLNPGSYSVSNTRFCMRHPGNKHLMELASSGYVERSAYSTVCHLANSYLTELEKSCGNVDELRKDYRYLLKCVADKEAELLACQAELANTRTDLKICEAGKRAALDAVENRRAKISKYEGMLGAYARAAAVASELAGVVTGIGAGSMRPNYRVDRLALMLRFHLDEVDKRLADK